MREKGHSPLSPSGAHRWMACPGSIAAESSYPESSSPYADEGIAAHRLAEIAARRGRPAGKWVGASVDSTLVTTEMADAVQFYLDYCAQLAVGAAHTGREQSVPIPLAEKQWGTVDFWAEQPKVLHVVDFKYGRGVPVTAVGNPQGRLYACGVLLYLKPKSRKAVQQVCIHVVQPRIAEGNGDDAVERVTTETLSAADLEHWFTNTALPAGQLALTADASRIPGDHCRFCRAKAACPEFRGAALVVAQQDFETLVAPDQTPLLPTVQDLTPEQLANGLRVLPLLEDWIGTFRGEARERLERGHGVPGWALAPKRGIRRWALEDAGVVQTCAERWHLDPEDMYDRKLKSPAQVEKLVGRGQIPDTLAPLVSSGYNVVPADHPHALPPAAPVDFGAVNPD